MTHLPFLIIDHIYFMYLHKNSIFYVKSLIYIFDSNMSHSDIVITVGISFSSFAFAFTFFLSLSTKNLYWIYIIYESYFFGVKIILVGFLFNALESLYFVIEFHLSFILFLNLKLICQLLMTLIMSVFIYGSIYTSTYIYIYIYLCGGDHTIIIHLIFLIFVLSELMSAKY